MEELFRLPPSEFTAARDTLAKRLKAEGDKEAAAAVKALRRPTVAAWAVNQVALEQPELVEAVVAAGAALGAAQEELLAGGGRDALRSATAARRDAVAEATKAAVGLAGEAQRDAITATFDAAATDEASAEAVRSGQLTKELEAPSGFGMFGGGDIAAAPPATATEKADRAAAEAARKRADDAARSAEEARARAEAAELRRSSLEAELATATEAADAAARDADEAEAAAADAAEEADRLGG